MAQSRTADRYQGDPKLILTQDGADLIFRGGQPLMDQGLENAGMISLFTEPGWCGNAVLRNTASRIGSRFLRRARGPITLSTLNDVRQAGRAALDLPAFGDVDITVTNPTQAQIRAVARISPPARTAEELVLTDNAGNWSAQSDHPAHERVKPEDRW